MQNLGLIQISKLEVFSQGLSAFHLGLLLIFYEIHHVLFNILGWTAFIFSCHKFQGICRTFMNADTATNAGLSNRKSRFPEFVPCFFVDLELQRIHRAPFYTKCAGLAGWLLNLHNITGGIRTFRMSKPVITVKKHAAATAAVADSIRFIPPVGDRVNQAWFGGLF